MPSWWMSARVCVEPGEQHGTLVEVQRTERFRIAALGPAAAETAGLQLFSAAASRNRGVVRDRWAEARDGALL